MLADTDLLGRLKQPGEPSRYNLDLAPDYEQFIQYARHRQLPMPLMCASSDKR
jgi:hypothetical protein